MPRTPVRRVRHLRLSDVEWSLVCAAAAASDDPPCTWLRVAAVRAAREQIAKDGAAAPTPQTREP